MNGPLSRAQYNGLINDAMNACALVIRARRAAGGHLGPTTMTTVDQLVAGARRRARTITALATGAMAGPPEAGTLERITALTHEIEACARAIEDM